MKVITLFNKLYTIFIAFEVFFKYYSIQRGFKKSRQGCSLLHPRQGVASRGTDALHDQPEIREDTHEQVKQEFRTPYRQKRFSVGCKRGAGYPGSGTAKQYR